MKFYHILIVMIILNVSALILFEYFQNQKTNDFLEYGQYQPEMMLLEHDEMLTLCDQYDLIYDFESGECK